MYRLPAFKGVAHQRGYGVSYIFKGLAKTFVEFKYWMILVKRKM